MAKREVVARGNYKTGYQGVIIVDGEDRLKCPHVNHKTTKEARQCVEDRAQDIIDSGAYI